MDQRQIALNLIIRQGLSRDQLRAAGARIAAFCKLFERMSGQYVHRNFISLNQIQFGHYPGLLFAQTQIWLNSTKRPSSSVPREPSLAHVKRFQTYFGNAVIDSAPSVLLLIVAPGEPASTNKVSNNRFAQLVDYLERRFLKMNDKPIVQVIRTTTTIDYGKLPPIVARG